jgi:DivIVA domain-containing protein
MRTNNQYDRFPIAKRGYDPHAVEAFLDVAAADNDRMLNEAAARIAALESELEEAKRQEEAVHLTILAATAAKDDMLEAARHQAGELTANGRMEGDRIVTDARMQAFQLVTEARKEAETIVVEARSEAAALARVDDGADGAADGSSEREAALQKRIEEMQQVVAAMELELSNRPTAADIEAALAQAKAANATPTDDAGSTENEPAAPVEDQDASPPTAAAEDHDDIEIVVADTPSGDRADDDTEIAVDDVAITVEAESQGTKEAQEAADGITAERSPDAVRRSFYSRRSARLPRIGAEGGRDSMAAIAGLRTNFVAGEAEGEADPEDKPAFETV